MCSKLWEKSCFKKCRVYSFYHNFLKVIVLGKFSRFKHQQADKIKLNVRFTYNRNPIKACHRAVESAEPNNIMNILFPQDIQIRSTSSPSQLR